MKNEELMKEINVTLSNIPHTENFEQPNRITINVDLVNLVEVASLLNKMGFDHVKSVTATDYPKEMKIDIVYHLSSYENFSLSSFIIALKTSVNNENPKVPTLTKIWPSTEFLERETYDLVGVIFEGHPEMKRILLPDDWEGPPPLLKLFKINTEGIES
jgi:NADH-quinone oxidoreductase subunit C